MSDQYETLETEYKGHPMLELICNRKLVIKIGLRKAKAILNCIEAIKDFVKKNDK